MAAVIASKLDVPVDLAAEGERAACPLGVLAAGAAMASGDVVLVAGDDREASLAADLVRALAPGVTVLAVPTADPPESPASVAVAGRRLGAVRALAERGGERMVLCGSLEAVLGKAPADDGAPFLRIANGDRATHDSIIAGLGAAGYRADDRVDEAGAFAARAQVVDLFPVDADKPVRIELCDGFVGAIRWFDPLTQLAMAGPPLEHLVIVPRKTERSSERCLVDLMPEATIASAELSAARRSGHRQLALPPAEAGARFVERRDAARAFRAALKVGREKGDKVVLAGSVRDLRFLAARAARGGGEAPLPVSDWREVLAAPARAFLMIEAPLESGWREDGLMVVAAADLLGGRAGEAADGGQAVFELEGVVRCGDVVVHEDHGVGVIQGLEQVEANGIVSDVLRLEHAKGAVRLVPVAGMDRLWRYGAEADAVTLDRLDGAGWDERRAEIVRAVAETARALVELAATRETIAAPKLCAPRDRYERFSSGFGHPLTPGQRAAVEAVEADLASGRPMDRLVVGDVGYGKTEVALRAAAIAVLAGHQVAVAAPTTVLVRQHLELFRHRFEPLGIEVASLSRHSSAAEARETRAGLADGSIGIVIGTQAIAADAVAFKSAGLLVIDEEQRFGAVDKQKLRSLGEGVHVLTLTATPIPRTLQSALVGLQQLSLITTPPARRQPIGTTVIEDDPEMIAAAFRRERERGGQSFMVVPQIADMDGRAAMLARFVPELKVIQAHGKMPAADIDGAMVQFAGGDGDVLLATNIIEAGLDVPRANTMVVWRADRFGLSQLHQLRGRVGRGGRRGGVLLVTEAGVEIASATLKRLHRLEAFDRLGAGFEISAQDLDLRGAGDLIGTEQAGHLKLVGVDLYQHLLALAVREARGEAVDDWQPELNMGLSGLLPEDWLPDEDLRIEFYGRLARADGAALDRLAAEMEDRFGALPAAAEALLDLARLRRLAKEARVTRIDAGPGGIALTPHADATWPGTGAVSLADKNGRWLLGERIEDAGERLRRAVTLLEAILD